MAREQFTIQRCASSGVEAVEADSARAFARHTHDQFGIGVIDRGAQKSLSGRGMVEAQAGDTITVNPGEVHDGIPIGSGGRSWKMLYFDPAFIEEAVCDMTEGRTRDCVLSRPAIRDRRLAVGFRALFSAQTASTAKETTVLRDESFLLLLARLIARDGADKQIRSAPAAILLARSMIDDDPAAPVTLADLAHASGLSRFQVVRGFARATGFTAHAYLIQRRLQLARKLIAGGTLLADAAVASGFADQSHMTRMFVRSFGISPGDYAGIVN